jgi:membrane fusion protein (multidrug efflux system)
MFFWPGRRNRAFDVVAIVLGMCILLAGAGCEEKEAAPPSTPPEVEVSDVVQRDVPIYQEWVAQLNGQVNADITPKCRDTC